MPLPSRAISHARGHLRVSRFAWQTTEKRETARSLPNGWLLNHVHLLLMNVFTHSSIFFAWMFPFFTNVCMIQWKSLLSSVKSLFSFYLLFLSKIYPSLFDWVCRWGRKNTNTCGEIILHERCNALSGWWVSVVYLVFFTILFTQNRGALIITHAQCTEQNIVSHTTGLTSTVPNYVDTAERVSSLLFSSRIFLLLSFSIKELFHCNPVSFP